MEEARRGELPPETCLVVESMSRLTRDCPYDGIGLARKIWDLGHTIAFTQGRWNGYVITGKERGVFGIRSCFKGCELGVGKATKKSARPP